MKNEKINGQTALLKSDNRENFSPKDKLLFENLLNNKKSVTLRKVMDVRESSLANISSQERKTVAERHKRVSESSPSPSSGASAAAPVAVPMVWQQIVQQIMLHCPVGKDVAYLQINLKQNFLPQTSLHVQNTSGVLCVNFVTDSSAVMDRLMPQLRSLKSYLAEKLDRPIHVTLKLRSVTGHDSSTGRHGDADSTSAVQT